MNDISEILEKVDMEHWLTREGLEYKTVRGKKGLQLNLKECPACGNDNYKVYIGKDSGLGNCFHGDCEKKYSKWGFISSHLKTLSNREIVEHLLSVVQEQGYVEVKAVKSYERPSLSSLQLPNSLPLPIKGKNLKYLSQRNITLQTVAEFKLRYCSKGSFSYFDDTGKKIFQNYDGRVIVPIYNLDNVLVSYQGRDATGTSEKRYLFPPGFASTGSIIYNGNNALGSVEICIGEGVFDVMAIHQALQDDIRLQNVIAVGSFGKHLSDGDEESQVAQLTRMKEEGLKKITFMWDAEPRAILDAVEVGLKLKSLGFIAKLALLPMGKDPNEVDPSVVREAFLNAQIIEPLLATKLKLKYGSAKD